jgi:hypothetical protein
VLTARAVGGQLTPSSESTDVCWVHTSEILSYSMDRSMRLRIMHYLESSDQPCLR